jgi:hypothetical protein
MNARVAVAILHSKVGVDDTLSVQLAKGRLAVRFRKKDEGD